MKKKPKRKRTVSYRDVRTIAMVTGGERKHPIVIHRGRRSEWVGIGWIDAGPATAADRKKYPTVV